MSLYYVCLCIISGILDITEDFGRVSIATEIRLITLIDR